MLILLFSNVFKPFRNKIWLGSSLISVGEDMCVVEWNVTKVLLQFFIKCFAFYVRLERFDVVFDCFSIQLDDLIIVLI